MAGLALAVCALGLLFGSQGHPVAAAQGTPVCGTLPPGATTWNAVGSPYQICPQGVIVPHGSTLNLDGTLGTVLVNATGNGGVQVFSGTIQTVNTSPTARILFGSTSTERGAWSGLHLGTDHFTSDTTQASLSYVDVTHAQTAINIANAHSVTLDHLSITDSRGGIFGGPGVSVSSSRVNGVDQDGIHLICAQHHGDPPTPKLPVVVNNNVIDAAGGYGIFVEGVFLDDCAPVSVRGNTVTNSGTAAPRHPAIAVGAFVAGLGPGQDIGDNTGGGNGLDAILLAGRVTTSATWIAPTNSKTVHPLGYLAGWVSFENHSVLSVPAGTVVKGGPGPNATLAGIIGNEGSIDASAGGAVFTSYSDNSVGLAVCPSILVSDCSPKAGDFARLGASGNGVSIVVSNATVRFAGSLSGGGTGPTAFTNTLVEHSIDGVVVGGQTAFSMSGGSIVDTKGTALRVSDAASAGVSGVHITDTGGWGIDISRSTNVAVTGNTVDGALGTGIHVDDGSPTVKNNLVINSGNTNNGFTGPEVAISIGGAIDDMTLGPSGSVDGNTGANNGINAIALKGNVLNSFTWRTARASTTLEPLGYLIHDVLRVRGPSTMTVPANSVVKGAFIGLDGATLDASAGGAIFTGLKDNSAGIDACPSASFNPMSCELTSYEGMSGIGIYKSPDGRSKGSATIVGAQLRRGGIHIESGATAAPGHSGFGLVFDRSTTVGPGSGIYGSATPVLIMDSVIARTSANGVLLQDGSTGVISGSVIADNPIMGVDTSDDIEITGTHLTGNGFGDPLNRGAAFFRGSATHSISCSSIHDNGAGVAAGPNTVVSRNDLYGNSGDGGRYDLAAAGSVDARQNWWGQPGGPVAGQVKYPENADTSNPLSAPSSCVPPPLPIPEEGAWGTFTPVTPARILDTRSAQPLGQGAERQVKVTGVGGVPATGVSAVVLNVTGTEPTAATFLTAWPSGSPRPTASNLNLVPGQTAPNLVTVKVGPGGMVSVYNNAGSTHMVVDVAGWYSDGSPRKTGRYTPVAPTRLVDTRQSQPIGQGSSISLQVTGVGGVPSTGVSAVILNLTGTEPTAATYLTVWPSGARRPTASNLNLVPGETRPNLVVAKVGAGGRVWIYNNTGATHVVADLEGWFSDGSTDAGATFTPTSPGRILDTRFTQRLGPGQKMDLNIPYSAFFQGVVLNVTATNPTAATYLTVWPADSPRPTTSNLNVVPGETAPNQVIVGAGNGALSIYNNAGSIDVVVDFAGWFWEAKV